MIKPTTLAALFLSAIAGISGCDKHDAPAAGPASPPVPPPPPTPTPVVSTPAPSPAVPHADFTVTADALLKELAASPDATAAKYKDKVIQISGVIADLFATNGSAVIRLNGGAGAGIECWINTGDPWSQIALGQQITLRGTGDLGFMKRIIDCTIADLGPSTAITTTADAMAAEYKAGADAFEKKYGDKTVRVTGVVLKKGAGRYGGTMIWLKGSGDLNVGCSPSSADSANADKLNSGDIVTFIGTCHKPSDDGEWLNMAKVLK